MQTLKGQTLDMHGLSNYNFSVQTYVILLILQVEMYVNSLMASQMEMVMAMMMYPMKQVLIVQTLVMALFVMMILK
jgi:hypothetical protein